MKNIIRLAAAVLILVLSSSAWGGDTALSDDQKHHSPEVILSGDSWATLPCFFGSAGDAFFNRNIDVDIHGCLETTKIGSRAENFAQSKAYQQTLAHLKNPYAKIVYLSIGGNDMFEYWTKTMAPAEEAAMFAKIVADTQALIDAFHKIRPDVWILVSGYDHVYMYPNNPISNYREIYEHMGSPDGADVSRALAHFNAAMATLKGDHVAFQHHVGLMHYWYGVPEANLGPYVTMPPALISPVSDPLQSGGVPTARNNKYAMAHIFNWYFDAHHLRPHGFMKLFEHAIDGYMAGWLKGARTQDEVSDDLTTLTSPPIDNDVRDGEVPAAIEAEGSKMAQRDFSGK